MTSMGQKSYLINLECGKPSDLGADLRSIRRRTSTGEMILELKNDITCNLLKR